MSAIIIDDSLRPIIERDIALEKERRRLKLKQYAAEIASLEAAHGISSAEFLQQYRKGELGDDVHWLRWEFLCETQEVLNEQLRRLEEIKYEGQNAP
jgi:hypothetical protein